MKHSLIAIITACLFATSAQGTPLLSGRSPADNSLNIPYNSNIVATFNENIVAGAGTITLNNLTNPARSRTITVSDTTQVTISGSVLTIDPIIPLDADTDYAVQFATTAVQNISNVPYAGIPETDVTSWNFRTGAPSVVDILVVYTPAALAFQGTEAGMLAHIQGCIAATNDAFARSGATGQIRLVGTQLVTYTESSSYIDDLNRLTNTSDGIMDNVHSLRNTAGADLVCLLRRGVDSSLRGGLAWQPLSTTGEPSRGFSVVQTEGALATLTLTHELGHNLGLGHARGDSQATGIFADSLGYRFTGLSGTQYRTIMAASGTGTRISHFSNPAVTFDGVATGVGPPSDSNSANAARTLSIMMPAIADFRTTATSNAAPSWSGNPFSAWDATVGQPYQTDLEINSTDLNSDALTHTLVSGPAWLSMTDSSVGRVVGTPTISNLGLNEFTVRVSDGVNPAVDAVMRINVVAETGGTWLGVSGNWEDASVWSGGTITDGAGSTANFTGIDIASNQTIAVTLSRTIGNIIFTDTGVSSNNLTLSGSSLTLDVSSGPPTIHVTQAERLLTISNRISGSKGLRKMGSGTLTLSGNNNYTGNTTITAGTMRLEGSAFSTSARAYSISSGAVLHNANSQIPTGTSTISGSGILRGSLTNAIGSGRTLNLSMGAGGLIDIPTVDSIYNGGWSAINWAGNNASLNVDGTLSIVDGLAITAAALTGSGSVTSSWDATAAAANFTLGANNGSGTFSGNITASGTRVVSLVKIGTGTQTFSGNTTFRGNTIINGGTLHFAKASSLYAGAASNWVKTKITVNNGGTIAFNVGGTSEFTTGNVTTLLNGLGGAVNNNGLRAGSTIIFDTTNASGGTFTISDVLANTTGTGGGAVGLRKIGSNTLVLSNTNTYTGPTAIDQGTLSVTGSLGATAVSVNSGTLTGNGSFGGNVTIAASATHSLAVAATTASQDTSTITGTLAMAGSTLNLTASSTPAAGVYTLATATAGITGLPGSIHYNGIKGTVSTDTTSFPNRLLLTITPYDYWAASHAPIGNADDDYDNDGVANAIEFVLGGDQSTRDLARLPAVSRAGSNMTFSFIRDQQSVASNLIVTIEVGTNLTTWPDVFTVGSDTTSSTERVTVSNNGDGTDTVTLTVPATPGVGHFARLKVSITE